MNTIYDLIIIWGGPAGTPIAMEYATLNPYKKILVVDKKWVLWWECLFDWCIPSKILEVSWKYIEDESKLNNLWLRHSKTIINWEKVVKKKKEILSKRSKAATQKLLSFWNIELYKGNAVFINENTIKINKNKDLLNEKFKFKKAVIATWSRTFISPFKGNWIKYLWTNDILFDKMELPKSLTIIWAWPIGVELSQILANYKVKVNLISHSSSILSMVEKKYSNIILNEIKANKNINIILNSDVKKIDYNNEEFSIEYKNKDTNENITINSSKVLISTGRTPNIEELQIKNAKINFDKKGIITNNYLQTSNKNIYAAGDVVKWFPNFAHTASYGAHIITQNLFFGRNKFKTNFNKNSWVLFSDPNFASAGLSETEAIKLWYNIIVGEYDYSIDAKAQIEEEDKWYLKYIVNKQNLKIIGIQILHKSANINAGEAALIVSKEVTLLDLVNSIHPHPTLSESFVFLAKDMMWNIMKKRMKNPLFKIGFLIKKWI